MNLAKINEGAITQQASGLVTVKLENMKDKKVAGLTEALVLAHKIVDDAGAVREAFLVATVFMALLNPNNEPR